MIEQEQERCKVKNEEINYDGDGNCDDYGDHVDDNDVGGEKLTCSIDELGFQKTMTLRILPVSLMD